VRTDALATLSDADIATAIRRHLDPEQLTVVLVGPPSAVVGVAEDLGRTMQTRNGPLMYGP
jgi:hypothetical protein